MGHIKIALPDGGQICKMATLTKLKTHYEAGFIH